MSERVGSDIERLWILKHNSYLHRLKIDWIKFRIVLCPIRHFPTSVSTNEVAWPKPFGSGLPLISILGTYGIDGSGSDFVLCSIGDVSTRILLVQIYLVILAGCFIASIVITCKEIYTAKLLFQWSRTVYDYDSHNLWFTNSDSLLRSLNESGKSIFW